MINTVKYKKLSPKAMVPTYGSEKAACFDLYADLRMQKNVVIPPHSTAKIGIGIAFDLPESCFMEIKQRSGLASKGIFPVGGICDEDYKGEIVVLLHNSSNADFIVNDHDRIAQAIIRHYHHINFYETDKLTESERGSNGFGSTGK